ncbi:hypothetical protein [Dickeya poaceiphila]|nr:hypothetical protein [Dickeya poaceiphila]
MFWPRCREFTRATPLIPPADDYAIIGLHRLLWVETMGFHVGILW